MHKRSSLIGLALLLGCSNTGSTNGTSAGSTGSGAPLCILGEQKACACPHGVQGAQVCLSDGSGFGACMGCDGDSGATSTSSGTTSGVGGAGGAGGASSTSTGGGEGGASTSSVGGGGGGGSTSSVGNGGAGGTNAGGGGGGGGDAGGGGGGGAGAGGGGGGGGGGPVCNVPGNCVHTLTIAETSGTSSGVTYTICPGGPNLNVSPPTCVLEIDLGNAALALMATPDPQQVSMSGTLPIRLQDLPMTFKINGVPGSYSAHLVLDGNGACPGLPQTFASLGVQATLTVNGAEPIEQSRPGCSALTTVDITIDATNLKDATHFCSSNVNPVFLDTMTDAMASTLAPSLGTAVKEAIDGQVCAK